MDKLKNFKKKKLKKLSKECSKAYADAYIKRVELEKYIKETNSKISDDWLCDKIEVNLVHEHTNKKFVEDVLDILGLKKKAKSQKDNKPKNKETNKSQKENKEVGSLKEEQKKTSNKNKTSTNKSKNNVQTQKEKKNKVAKEEG